MAIQLPQSTDKLSSPSHSLSHRVFANDNAAPEQSVVVDALGNITMPGSLTVGSVISNVVPYTGKITVVTDTYNILATDYTVIANKTTDFTITLPTATVGQIFNIKNINTGIVTVEGASTDTIDGELNQTLGQWDSITLQCYLANSWVIL